MAFEWEALKDILRCPKSKSRLVHDGERLVSVDPQCRLSYPVADGIPILLVDEARELSPDEWSAVMRRSGVDPDATDGAP